MAKFELNSRLGFVLVGALAFIAAYIIAIRAVDTGSLWQYLLSIVLIIFGLNRFIKAARGK